MFFLAAPLASGVVLAMLWWPGDFTPLSALVLIASGMLGLCWAWPPSPRSCASVPEVAARPRRLSREPRCSRPTCCP